MTTTLNGQTIADPYDYQAKLEYLGSQRRSVNGTILLDYFSNTPKRKITLQWRLLSSSERSALITQLNNAVTQAQTLVVPDGGSFSVFLDVNGDVTETMIKTSNSYLYNIPATFIEA